MDTKQIIELFEKLSPVTYEIDNMIIEKEKEIDKLKDIQDTLENIVAGLNEQLPEEYSKF